MLMQWPVNDVVFGESSEVDLAQEMGSVVSEATDVAAFNLNIHRRPTHIQNCMRIIAISVSQLIAVQKRCSHMFRMIDRGAVHSTPGTINRTWYDQLGCTYRTLRFYTDTIHVERVYQLSSKDALVSLCLYKVGCQPSSMDNVEWMVIV